MLPRELQLVPEVTAGMWTRGVLCSDKSFHRSLFPRWVSKKILLGFKKRTREEHIIYFRF